MSKVLAVITTFFPNFSVTRNIEIIKEQADLTLIVDNGSDEQSQQFLQKFEGDPKVKIIWNEQNLGIATSCNLSAWFLLKLNEKITGKKNDFFQGEKLENWQKNLTNHLSNQENAVYKPEAKLAKLEIEIAEIIQNETNETQFQIQNETKNQREKETETFDWLLTFDQDSTPDHDFLSKMLSLSGRASVVYGDQLGVICPTYFYKSTGYLEKKNLTEVEFCEMSASMSSGSLISRRVFEQGVFFEDRFFVDYFDSEFHLKVRQNGFKLLEASKITLTHELGKITKATLFGKSFIPSNQPAFRRYYQARNRFVFYWRYFLFDPKWCLQDLRNSVMDIVKMLLVETDKFAKFQAFCLGTLHGAINKYQNPAPKFK
jgi:GT2 family glycosyltransferase